MTGTETILLVEDDDSVRAFSQAVLKRRGGLGARALELFAGTGALSLECLSRGAADAVCVELSPRHARFIEQNVAAAGLPREKFRVRVQDVFVALPQLGASGAQFDLVLADPPYGEKNVGRRSQSLAQQLLDDVGVAKILAPDGI